LTSKISYPAYAVLSTSDEKRKTNTIMNNISQIAFSQLIFKTVVQNTIKYYIIKKSLLCNTPNFLKQGSFCNKIKNGIIMPEPKVLMLDHRGR
jgi:hypothetical protein